MRISHSIFFVLLGFIVSTSINFNYYSSLRTTEVSNVTINGILAIELQSKTSLCSELLPQTIFRRCFALP